MSWLWDASFPNWIIALYSLVTVWVRWSPDEPEDDLHGFWTQRERDDCERGKPGPFRRIVRDHHRLGHVPDDVQAVRDITKNWK